MHPCIKAEQLAGVHLSERDRATAVLRATGLLTELSPEEKERAAQSTLTLEEARAILWIVLVVSR